MQVQRFLDLAKENEKNLADDEQSFPDSRYHWKTTFIFYTALHWMKAFLISKWGLPNPTSHEEVRNHFKKKPDLMSESGYKSYTALYKYSHNARYDGINPDRDTWLATRKDEYTDAKKQLESLRKYLQGNRKMQL